MVGRLRHPLSISNGTKFKYQMPHHVPSASTLWVHSLLIFNVWLWIGCVLRCIEKALKHWRSWPYDKSLDVFGISYKTTHFLSSYAYLGHLFRMAKSIDNIQFNWTTSEPPFRWPNDDFPEFINLKYVPNQVDTRK